MLLPTLIVVGWLLFVCLIGAWFYGARIGRHRQKRWEAAMVQARNEKLHQYLSEDQ